MESTIHQYIRDYMYTNKVTVRALATGLNMSVRNVYILLKDGNITVSHLQHISKVLNHNFFIFYTGGADTSAEITTLREENATLQQRIIWLEKENTQLELINKLLAERGK
ncbi:MAG: hypothetical protein M0R21_11290 [Lentimicrobiaceae bacterium]|nr:hypothetical protein [Lentimicrobiaceae bacterium]